MFLVDQTIDAKKDRVIFFYWLSISNQLYNIMSHDVNILPIYRPPREYTERTNKNVFRNMILSEIFWE